MKRMNVLIVSIAAGLAAAPLARGSLVSVTINGEVEYNQIRNSPIDRDHVFSGSPAVMTFQLDTNDYQDSLLYPVRGYAINQASFTLTLNGIPVALQNPYPAGQTPYFCIRNNDPAVDGFFLSSNPDAGFPEGVPTNEPGLFGQFFDNFYVTYLGSTLPSLDVLDAVGSYDYTDLTVFHWTMDDGEFGPEAMGLLFTDMTITPEPSSIALLTIVGVALIRRRRA